VRGCGKWVIYDEQSSVATLSSDGGQAFWGVDA
jgi:hypothetical protein